MKINIADLNVKKDYFEYLISNYLLIRKRSKLINIIKLVRKNIIKHYTMNIRILLFEDSILFQKIKKLYNIEIY